MENSGAGGTSEAFTRKLQQQSPMSNRPAIGRGAAYSSVPRGDSGPGQVHSGIWHVGTDANPLVHSYSTDYQQLKALERRAPTARIVQRNEISPFVWMISGALAMLVGGLVTLLIVAGPEEFEKMLVNQVGIGTRINSEHKKKKIEAEHSSPKVDDIKVQPLAPQNSGATDGALKSGGEETLSKPHEPQNRVSLRTTALL